MYHITGHVETVEQVEYLMHSPYDPDCMDGRFSFDCATPKELCDEIKNLCELKIKRFQVKESK
jgi:hypothetical protein